MRKATKLGFFLVCIAAVATALWLALLRGGILRQRERIAALTSLAARLTLERVPLRFSILAREGGMVRVKIKLYDLDGRMVREAEADLPGTELFFDFLVSPLGAAAAEGDLGRSLAGTWLAFPRVVFTDRLPANAGFDIGPTDTEGLPLVFGSASLSAGERAAIRAVYRGALADFGLAPAPSSDLRGGEVGSPGTRGPKDLGGVFGSAVHEVAGLARFEPGLVYKVVCRLKGGIEILED